MTCRVAHPVTRRSRAIRKRLVLERHPTLRESKILRVLRIFPTHLRTNRVGLIRQLHKLTCLIEHVTRRRWPAHVVVGPKEIVLPVKLITRASRVPASSGDTATYHSSTFFDVCIIGRAPRN